MEKQGKNPTTMGYPPTHSESKGRGDGGGMKDGEGIGGQREGTGAEEMATKFD